MKHYLAILATSAVAMVAVPAPAAPIIYTFTGSFSGTLNGDPFSEDTIFTGIGDTDNVLQAYSVYLQLDSLSALAGGVTYNVTVPSWLYINPNGYAGLQFGAFNDTSYFSGDNAGLIGNDLKSNTPTTAITYFSGINAPFLTDKGAVIVKGATNGTFSSTLAGAVPEPATWAMMIGGLALTGASMRRRKTAVSFA